MDKLELKKGLKFTSKWFEGVVEIDHINEEDNDLEVYITPKKSNFNSGSVIIMNNIATGSGSNVWGSIVAGGQKRFEHWNLQNTIWNFEQGDYQLLSNFNKMNTLKQLDLFSNEAPSKGAVLSDCGKYRYSLTRIWDDTKPRVLFIMLNPSTADAEKNDPTIRRCIGFAKDWGYGGLYVVNLFALRATNPKDLLTAPFVVGIENEKWIRRMSSLAHLVVCAWGNGAIVDKLQKRLDHTWKPLSWVNKPLHYLELSNDGTPKHPLYLPKHLTPKSYEVSSWGFIK